MRALTPFIAFVTLTFSGATLFALLPVSPFAAGVGAGIVGIASIFAFGRLPREARYWEKGARGEAKTAEYLEPLLDRGFVLLHDRRIPGRRGNIDHLLIGPSGVFVIETKNLSGAIDVTNDTLFVSDSERQWYVDQVYQESVAVQVALSDILNPLRLTVTPVLCIHGARLPAFEHAVAGVRLLSAKELRRLAEQFDTRLDAEQVQDVARAADQRLRPMYSWET